MSFRWRQKHFENIITGVQWKSCPYNFPTTDENITLKKGRKFIGDVKVYWCEIPVHMIELATLTSTLLQNEEKGFPSKPKSLERLSEFNKKLIKECINEKKTQGALKYLDFLFGTMLVGGKPTMKLIQEHNLWKFRPAELI